MCQRCLAQYSKNGHKMTKNGRPVDFLECYIKKQEITVVRKSFAEGKVVFSLALKGLHHFFTI